MEAEKSAMARTLHDEVGGLLVGAVMDLSWVSQQGTGSDGVKARLARAIGLLREAIDIKRKLVETLRPSLLDDVGLCPTISWHLKASCKAAGVSYSESYPPEEPPLSSDFKIAMFRIFQKALRQIMADELPSELSLQLEIEADTLHCRITSHSASPSTVTEATVMHTPLHHSARQRGGACEYKKTGPSAQLVVTIPLPMQF